MDKLQKIKSLVKKYENLLVFTDEKTKKNIHKVLMQISKESFNLGTQSFQDIHLGKDNHRIGIELESYCNVLDYRGFEKESNILLEVASKLK